MNLKDSGCDVCVGLREGSKNWANAEKAGLAVKTVVISSSATRTMVIRVTLGLSVSPETMDSMLYPFRENSRAASPRPLWTGAPILSSWQRPTA